MKQADAIAIARGIFPHMTEDELISVLWQETDYPDALGDNPVQMLSEQLQAFKDLLVAHGAKLETEEPTDNDLKAENQRLRRMLYEMTGASEWMQGGYGLDNYNALVAEFETKS